MVGTKRPDRYIRSQRTTSHKIEDERDWFSRRTHGVLQPNVGTIRNTRDKIKRNRRVSVNGAPVVKFKRSSIYLDRIPVPTTVK